MVMMSLLLKMYMILEANEDAILADRTVNKTYLGGQHEISLSP